LGSDRDYGTDGQAVFNSNVPAKLVTAMKKTGKGYVFETWQKAGEKQPDVAGAIRVGSR